ncbi:hypothetical protein SAMN04487969_12335 [Paenibacillus algorifonticola]|uniref:Uncharacterized protein n=1 Tax=Paenibacillus algorifonticola TaxID=684063 RepID=A0A1I2HF19_9BACL|nr:hypothetical protein [Paenibacillus algorifonticola]SFF28774.1 hypothetical protein SAMN04487969_12335 [Paenibacillus algorifonticola]
MIGSIYETETLEQLTEVIQTAPVMDDLREQLIAEYRRLFHYANIKQWNELVRVCEALAITGWGASMTPVEAVAEKWINGSYYTELRTRTFEQIKGSCKGWSKQQDSFIIHDGSDNTDYGIAAFASQRNLLPKNPLRLVRSGNYQLSAKPFIDSLSELRRALDEHMRQELYGDSFSYIGIYCFFSHHDDAERTLQYEYFHEQDDVPDGFEHGYYIKPKFAVGKLASRKGELKLEVTRHFTRAEGELPLSEQQQLFKADMLVIVDLLEEKLRKKKLSYRVDLLRQDLIDILEKWTTKGNAT